VDSNHKCKNKKNEVKICSDAEDKVKDNTKNSNLKNSLNTTPPLTYITKLKMVQKLIKNQVEQKKVEKEIIRGK
jgi:hypothetical protein